MLVQLFPSFRAPPFLIRFRLAPRELDLVQPVGVVKRQLTIEVLPALLGGPCSKRLILRELLRYIAVAELHFEGAQLLVQLFPSFRAPLFLIRFRLAPREPELV